MISGGRSSIVQCTLMFETRLAIGALFALIATTAWPQGSPEGPEFRVNTYTVGDQSHPSISDDNGFIVVWTSAGQDGSGDGVFGQMYFDSTPLGPEFRVNSYTTNAQRSPAVGGSGGGLMVVWTSDGQDGSSLGIFAQRYAAGGAVGPEFQINTYTSGVQSYPAVAYANFGGVFVVVWQSFLQDGSGYGIYGQRYASSGTPLGPEFRVNSFTTGNQHSPAVAAETTGDGAFAVVWTGENQDGSGDGIFGQRYSSSGAPLGDEFRVNSYTTNDQVSPRMSPGGQGGISTVVWMSDGQDGSGWGIFGRALFLNEGFLGQEFQVNSYTTGSQSFPAAAAAGPGYRVIVWQSDAQDGSGTGIYGQRYAGSGGRTSGPEFRVNTYTSGDQARPSVTAEGTTSQFRIVWDGPAEDGTPGLEVYGQRFGPIFPVELIDVSVE